MINQNTAFALLLSSIAIVTASNAGAQVSKSVKIGNDYLGVDAYAYATAKFVKGRNPRTVIFGGGNMLLGSAHARGSIYVVGKLLKRRATMGAFTARGDVYARTSGASAYGSYRVTLAGKKIAGRSFSTSTTMFRSPLFSKTFTKDVSKSISVSIFTASVKGNILAGIKTTGVLSLNRAPSVLISATARAWGYANAEASVGIRYIASAGAKLSGRIAPQTLNADLYVTKTRIRGLVQFVSDSIRLKLVIWGKLLRVYREVTLLNFYRRRSVQTLLRF